MWHNNIGLGMEQQLEKVKPTDAQKQTRDCAILDGEGPRRL